MEIQKYPLEQVPEALAKAADRLQRETWPKANWDAKTDATPTDLEKRQNTMAFLVTEGDLLGYAEIFPRMIYAEHQEIDIWALASVCVVKAKQGLGLGRALVQACFSHVDQNNGISLFQTGVPGFYEKLGCRIVENQFVNKTDTLTPDKNPFSDDYAMIYPANYSWPEGIIDLNGRGY